MYRLNRLNRLNRLRDLHFPSLLILISLQTASSSGLLATPALKKPEISTKQRAFFETRIRPVLVEHCYECHAVDSHKIKGDLLLDSRAGWMRGGESGDVIVPGKPEDSLLMEALEHEFVEMPPKKKLPQAIVDDFREWISMGAPDPREEKKGVKREKGEDYFDLEARKRFWSYQPVISPKVPEVKDANWAWDDIDRFVLAKLEAEKLKPADQADGYTLYRRINYILTGLPPAPESARQFQTSYKRNPRAAVRQAVDELLASPHFGERWARHWMDLMRYADTKGFEADYAMPYVYPYRDYLIRAFNADVPYSQFILEALAGDQLKSPRLNTQTGINESELGPGWFYLTDGHHGPPDIHEDQVRIFDNMIDVIGKAFLGQTIACARCHDHKFDAITAGDFYSLYGILESSRLNYVNQQPRSLLEAQMHDLKQAKATLKSQLVLTLADQLAHLTLNGDAREQALRQLHEARRHPLHPLALDMVDLLMPAKKTKSTLSLKQGQSLGNKKQRKQKAKDRILPPGHVMNSVLPTMTREQFGSWMVSGLGFGDMPAKPGDFVVDQDGFKAFVGGFPSTGRLSSRFHGSIKSPSFQLNGSKIQIYARGHGARINLYVRNYELVGYGPTTNRLSQVIDHDQWKRVTFDTSLWQGEWAYLEILHNGRQLAPVRKRQHESEHFDDQWVMFTAPGTLIESQLQNVTREQLLEQLRTLPAKWRDNQLSLEESDLLSALYLTGLVPFDYCDLSEAFEAYHQQQTQASLPTYARSLCDGDGRDTPVYLRGMHTAPSPKPNPRRFMDALDPVPFETAGSGRLEWATKIARRDNPLTRRIIVNRLWHHVFGQGIVTSVDDFGLMGQTPTHPQLLDFLATKFDQEGWSIKRMIRQMMLTRTFVMESKASERSRLMDPKNLYLQHFSRRKLEAEAIRDTILTASGELNLKMYGPSVPVNLHESSASRARPSKSGPLNGRGRRSIYLEIRRNFMPRFLLSFDFPAGNQTYGARDQTQVPAQSLLLLNDPFIHEQAKHWGEKMFGQVGSFREKVDRMHREFLGRPANQRDISWAESTMIRLLESHQLQDLSQVNQACWQAFCHIMFNRKEALYVF